MMRVGVEPPPARSMPRMKSTGDIPPLPPRGAVTPPPIMSERLTCLIARYAGLSRRLT